MAKLEILAGATSQSVNVFIQNSSSTTGAGLTGLVFNTSSLIAYYTFTGTNAGSVQIVLATLSAVNSAYSSGGFKEIDSTNMPGLYRLDLPNAALATSKGQSVVVYLSGAANMAPCLLEIELVAYNNQTGTNLGLSALPTANPGAANGIFIAGTNVATTINGTAAAGATPATAALTLVGGAASTTSGGTSAPGISSTGGAGAASTNGASAGITATGGGTTTVTGGDGVTFTATGAKNGLSLVHAGAGLDLNAQTTNALQVNTTAINAVSASSVTTINANQGTTQPVNFTGTGASALVKVDVTDIATAAVNTGSAQLGVNVVTWLASTPNGLNAGRVDAVANIRSNTAQAGASNTITLDASASAASNFYDLCLIFITGGTGVGQVRQISSYTGSTKVAGVSPNWATNPDNTSTFTIIPFGTCDVTSYTGQPVSLDANNILKVDVQDWNGSAAGALPTNFSSLSIDASGRVTLVPGQIVVKKNTSFTNFPFLMVLSSDHVSPATGLTVAVQRSIDGGAFANCTNTPATELSNGIYYITLSAGDLNGGAITLKCTSATADARMITILTQP